MDTVPKILELKGIDPETAFNEAQREARHLYGHSGRTGTLADADGCIVVSGPALLPWDCRRVAQQVLRDGHAKPGGPVFLLRLADLGRSRTVRAMVDITGMLPGQADDAIDAAVREKISDEGWGISAVEVRDEDAEGTERKGLRRSKVVLTPGKGARITRYSIRHAETGRELTSKENLSAARVWMKDALLAGSAPMVCVGEFVKEDGPLLSGASQVLKQTVAVVGTVGAPVPGGNGSYLAAGSFPLPGN
jgi:hypothetical protein